MLTPPLLNLAGLIRSRGQLLDEGLTDNQIARLVRDKVLHRVRHGAYVPYAVWRQLSAEDRHRVRARALLAGAHPDTVLTHTSSLVERRVPLWGLGLEHIHTTRGPAGPTGRRVPDWIPHRGVLAASQVEHLDGVPVSTAARSALEVTTIAGVEAALVAVCGLLHSGATTVAELADEVARCKFWPGTLTSDLVVRLADPRPESVGERRFLFLTYRQGLPRPEPQVEIRDEHGELVARLDFAWPDFGVFLEFDGRVKYERFRREGETLEEFLMREKRREEEVSQLTGWTCIRISWADLERPELLAARIRRVLSTRRSHAS